MGRLDEFLDRTPSRVLKGHVVGGIGDFRRRMTKFAEVFHKATGQNLVKGTLNVDVGESIAPNEHFRIVGADIGEPEQDLLFEICRANGIWAYRIRPYNLKTGAGGHGDNILEIASSEIIPTDTGVEIALFRE